VSEPLLVAEELEKEYRTGPEVVRVLRGASLVVRPGEIVALVGASGVGKSTLLHLLGALDRPTAGRVLFRGEDLFARGEAGLVHYRRQEVGFVFQFYNLLGELSALENAMIPALLLRKPPARRGSWPRPRSPRSAWPTGCAITRASCRVASSSASRSPGPSRTAPGWFSPTSPRAI